jgi:FMN reductase
MTNIVVISAGISVPSSTRILAEALGAATVRALSSVEPVDTTTASYDVIELRDLAHLITDNALTGFPTGALADAVRRVAEADAVIAVTPVYTGSYSGLFKMFVDVLEDGTLEGKPVLIAATAGTARHSLVLEYAIRPLFAYLRADVVPTAVFAASEDFGGRSLRGTSLSARVDRAGRELADKVLRRGTTLPEDPFANPVPFEDLLRDI